MARSVAIRVVAAAKVVAAVGPRVRRRRHAREAVRLQETADARGPADDLSRVGALQCGGATRRACRRQPDRTSVPASPLRKRA